jgi:hypothetical protein
MLAGRVVIRQAGEGGAQADPLIEIEPGDAIVVAVGPEPNRDVVPEVEAAGVPYVLIGDCNRPGDFLTAIRDASLAALALSTTISNAGVDGGASDALSDGAATGRVAGGPGCGDGSRVSRSSYLR